MYVGCYYAILHCLLLDLIFINYIQRYIEKDILSIEEITESPSLATYDLGYCTSSRWVTNIRLQKELISVFLLCPPADTERCLRNGKKSRRWRMSEIFIKSYYWQVFRVLTMYLLQFEISIFLITSRIRDNKISGVLEI